MANNPRSSLGNGLEEIENKSYPRDSADLYISSTALVHYIGQHNRLIDVEEANFNNYRGGGGPKVIIILHLFLNKTRRQSVKLKMDCALSKHWISCSLSFR